MKKLSGYRTKEENDLIAAQSPRRSHHWPVETEVEVRVADLTGQDLAYWVARANSVGSPMESDILRRHYGHGVPKHDPANEPQMRVFVSEKFGELLPPRRDWQ